MDPSDKMDMDNIDMDTQESTKKTTYITLTQPPTTRAGVEEGWGKIQDLVHLETMFENYGREDGQRDGSQSGELEGRILGISKGHELAHQIGFYQGLAEQFLFLLQSPTYASRLPIQPTTSLEKVIKQFEMLLALTKSFPLENSDRIKNVDLMALVDKVVGKYKLCMSLLGLHTVSGELGKSARWCRYKLDAEDDDVASSNGASIITETNTATAQANILSNTNIKSASKLTF